MKRPQDHPSPSRPPCLLPLVPRSGPGRGWPGRGLSLAHLRGHAAVFRQTHRPLLLCTLPRTPPRPSQFLMLGSSLGCSQGGSQSPRTPQTPWFHPTILTGERVTAAQELRPQRGTPRGMVRAKGGAWSVRAQPLSARSSWIRATASGSPSLQQHHGPWLAGERGSLGGWETPCSCPTWSWCHAKLSPSASFCSAQEYLWAASHYLVQKAFRILQQMFSRTREIQVQAPSLAPSPGLPWVLDQ